MDPRGLHHHPSRLHHLLLEYLGHLYRLEVPSRGWTLFYISESQNIITGPPLGPKSPGGPCPPFWPGSPGGPCIPCVPGAPLSPRDPGAPGDPLRP